MAVYHVVLFALKAATSPAQIAEFKQLVHAMVGKVPGLQRVDVGPPHASTAHRAQGYDLAIVAILDKPETLKVYAEHPSHQLVQKLREEIAGKALAYDLEFEP